MAIIRGKGAFESSRSGDENPEARKGEDKHGIGNYGTGTTQESDEDKYPDASQGTEGRVANRRKGISSEEPDGESGELQLRLLEVGMEILGDLMVMTRGTGPWGNQSTC